MPTRRPLQTAVFVVAFAASAVAGSAWAVAHAQEPTPEHSLDAPDVVTLRDGTRLRGRIVSDVVASALDLSLASGIERTIQRADVASVTRLEPPPPVAPPPAARSQVALREAAGSDGPLTFYRVTGTTEHVPIRRDIVGLFATAAERSEGDAPRLRLHWTVDRWCTAPCDTSLPDGMYHLAVARGTLLPTVLDVPVEVRGPTTLRATMDDRSGMRTAGAWTVVGSLLGGAALALAGALATDADGNPSVALFLTGAGVGIVGAVTGFVILVASRDRLSVRAERR